MAASPQAIMLLYELVMAAASKARDLGIRVQFRFAQRLTGPLQRLWLDELRVDGQRLQLLLRIFWRLDVQGALDLVAISCARLLQLMG